MIDVEEARRLVEKILHKKSTNDKELEIVHISENEYGWIFSWNSKKYLETNDSKHALLGNGPIFVDKFEGESHQFGTGQPVEFFLAEFEKNLPSNQQVKWQLYLQGQELPLKYLSELTTFKSHSLVDMTTLKVNLPIIKGNKYQLKWLAFLLQGKGISVSQFSDKVNLIKD